MHKKTSLEFFIKKYFFLGLFCLAFIFPKNVHAATYTCSVTGKTTSTLPANYFHIMLGTNLVPHAFSADNQYQNEKIAFFKELKDAGFQSVRIFINWNDSLEPSRGNINWAIYDSIFTAAESAGIKITPSFTNAPSWAKSDPSKTSFLSKYYPDWQNFVTLAVNRYGIRTGTVAREVSDWELWNEPYNSFSGTPAEITTISNLAYDAIKAADPKAQVISPTVGNVYIISKLSTCSSSPDRITSFFCTYIKTGKYDLLGVHLYSDDKTVYNSVVKLKSYLTSQGKNPKIAITETNLGFPAKSCSIVNSLSQDAMASVAVNRYVCLAQSGANSTYYFDARDLPNNNGACVGSDPYVNVGLLNNDASYTPRKAYYALQQMIKTLTSKPGDFNGDGKVDINDYNLIKSKFANPYTIFDYNQVFTNYGK